MAFTDTNTDPIKEMGIGYEEVEFNLDYFKGLSIERLNELYHMVYKKTDAPLCVTNIYRGYDKEPFKKLERRVQIELNNMIVSAHNYLVNTRARDKSRALNLTKDDIVLILGDDEVNYYCMAQFSKRGIIKTDGHGRLILNVVAASIIDEDEIEMFMKNKHYSIYRVQAESVNTISKKKAALVRKNLFVK